MQKLFYARTRNVKQPERGTSRSAGIDFFMPEFTDDFLKDLIDKNPNYSQLRPGNHSYYIIKDEKKILLAPNERLMIPSGIKIRGHANIAINAHNKSGVGTKKGLDRLAEVVDEDYQGEIHISIVNTSNFIVEICENDKLIQWLEVHVDYSELEELPETQLFIEETERGDKGFGSTDKNQKS
jgi:dUTP pyrophosphatase